ncbi:hypothetical protein RJ639_026634, partial [Escallonia herrerae]
MESASAEPMPKVRELLEYYGGGGVRIHVNQDNNSQNPKAEQEATKTRLKLWERLPNQLLFVLSPFFTPSPHKCLMPQMGLHALTY